MRVKAPLLRATQQWKRQVRERLAELGWSQAELARRVGCSAPAITLLLKPDTQHSRFVQPISDELSISLSGDAISDRELSEWMAVGKELAPEERDLILGLIQLWTRRR